MTVDRTTPPARWVKSTYSHDAGVCVEVGWTPGVGWVRDSKDPHGPALAVPTAEFGAVLDAIRAGRLG